MSFHFKWKEKETQQAVLFWAAVGLLIYWGVRRNFNVNEIIGVGVIYILTGQYLFGGRNKEDEPSKSSDSEIQRVVQKTKSDSKRETTSSEDSVGDNFHRHRYLFSKIYRRHNLRVVSS